MPHELKYEVLVSARTREEAIEIAAEGLGPDQHVVRTAAEDVSRDEGPDSWRVTLWFTGGRRGGDGPSEGPG